MLARPSRTLAVSIEVPGSNNAGRERAKLTGTIAE